MDTIVESEEEQRIIRLIHYEAHLGKQMCDTFCNKYTL